MQRYDIFQVHYSGDTPRGEMRPTEDGEWVLYEEATAQPTPEMIEAVARAIDDVWWKWADVHYREDLPGDRLERERSLNRAKSAIAAIAKAEGRS